METLPTRNHEDEDAFVALWRERDQPEQLMDLISAAIDARRPQLAARLVGLLSEQIEVTEDSPIAQARRAARLLMLPEAHPHAFDVLEDAWAHARRKKIKQIKRRMRGAPPNRPRTPRRR